MGYRHIAQDYLNSISAEEILVTNRSFLYGEGVFTTTLHTFHGPVLWESHLQRLVEGWLHFYPMADEVGIKSRLNRLVNSIPKKNIDECLKIHLFCNDIERQLGRSSQSRNPNIVLTVSSFEKSSSVSLKSVKIHNKQSRKFKTPNYLAETHYPANTLFHYPNGEILEGLVSNIFFVKNSIIYTPKLSDAIYPGLARNRLIEKLNVIEEKIYLSELDKYDSAFLTNSLQLMIPIDSINKLKFSNDSKFEKKIREVLC